MGDQFWHPEGVQAKASNSRIILSPPSNGPLRVDLVNILLEPLSGPLAFSDSRILPFDLGPEAFETRSRRAGFQPSGPVETFVFP